MTATPTASRATTYTVQEAAAQTGLSEHTLRYYERASLLPRIQRDHSSRHRRYTEEDLRRVEFLKRMRATGMPICEMQQYVALYLRGDSTVEERLTMLEAHGRHLREHIADLQAHLTVIEYKIENYKRLGAERHWTTDDCLTIAEQSEATTSQRRGIRTNQT